MSGAAWFWIAAGALALGSVFSTLFQSLRNMARSVMEEAAASRGERARRRVRAILDDPEGHATGVGLPRILCNLVVAVALVYWVASMRGERAPSPADAVIGVAAASLMIWVFGLVLPNSVATHAAESAVLAGSRLLRAFHVLHAPLRGVSRFFDEMVKRLAGKPDATEAEALTAELLSVVDEGAHEGRFGKTERDMIEAVVRFRETTVVQIMTPRTEMEALELTNNLGDVTRFIRSCRHSRIPVYEGSLDQVAGIFYIKDLMRWLAGPGTQGAQKPFELKTILRPALFVPETKTIRELLGELLEKKVHIALVADEYGGTSGLVTFEDIVEEVFGEIRDEYEIDETDEHDVRLHPDGRAAEIDARAYIHDANERLRGLGVELPEGEDYDTVGGLVVTTLGRIPSPGESVRVGSAVLTVLGATPTRVSRVRLEVREPEPEPPEPPPTEARVVTPRRDQTPVGE